MEPTAEQNPEEPLIPHPTTDIADVSAGNIHEQIQGKETSSTL